MMLPNPRYGRERIAAMVAVALIHGLLLWALLAGLGGRAAMPETDSLKLFDVREPPPAVTVEEPKPASAAPGKARARPNLRADPTAVVAPPPEIRVERPAPVPVAPIAGSGAATSAGASERTGPGLGAGGSGTGVGAGGPGTGIAVPARQIAGRIANRDYPASARRAGVEGRVLVRFAVHPSGRAGSCIVLRSSGNADLDTATCRLIERRFRFEPARDAAGRPVPDTKMWEQIWWLAR